MTAAELLGGGVGPWGRRVGVPPGRFKDSFVQLPVQGKTRDTFHAHDSGTPNKLQKCAILQGSTSASGTMHGIMAFIAACFVLGHVSGPFGTVIGTRNACCPLQSTYNMVSLVDAVNAAVDAALVDAAIGPSA